MKKTGLLLLCMLQMNLSHAVIYGGDNREDLVDFFPRQNSLFSKNLVAVSTVGKIFNRNLQKVELAGQTFYQLKGRKIGEGKRYCTEVPFADQLAALHVSGVLIGPDIILTAEYGAQNCEMTSWVFDFETRQAQGDLYLLPENSVVKCKRVLLKESGYAAIQLERSVARKYPAVQQDELQVGDELIMAGHSMGGPLKLTDDAEVTQVGADGFKNNLDTFAGMGGGPIFNAKTGQLVGIQHSGEQDFVYNHQRVCTELKQCPQYGCRGEKAIKASSVDFEKIFELAGAEL